MQKIHIISEIIFYSQNMKKNPSGFTLLEVMIAASILTIWVFGIYKMISSNMLLLANAEQKQEMTRLFDPFSECLSHIWYDSLSGSFASETILSFNFWEKNLDCMIGNYSTDYSFSGVTSGKNEYFLFARKLPESDSTKLMLEANIYSPTFWEYSQSGKILTIEKK